MKSAVESSPVAREVLRKINGHPDDLDELKGNPWFHRYYIDKESKTRLHLEHYGCCLPTDSLTLFRVEDDMTPSSICDGQSKDDRWVFILLNDREAGDLSDEACSVTVVEYDGNTLKKVARNHGRFEGGVGDLWLRIDYDMLLKSANRSFRYRSKALTEIVRHEKDSKS